MSPIEYLSKRGMSRGVGRCLRSSLFEDRLLAFRRSLLPLSIWRAFLSSPLFIGRRLTLWAPLHLQIRRPPRFPLSSCFRRRLPPARFHRESSSSRSVLGLMRSDGFCFLGGFCVFPTLSDATFARQAGPYLTLFHAILKFSFSVGLFIHSFPTALNVPHDHYRRWFLTHE